MKDNQNTDIEKVKLRLLDEAHYYKQNPSRAYLDFIKSHADKPVIIAIPVTDDSVSFVCPWCNNVHTHSSKSGKRASHCPKHQDEYYIFNPSDRTK